MASLLCITFYIHNIIMALYVQKGNNMDIYYINKNNDGKGYNEVHTSNCNYLPEEKNRIYLGVFSDEIQAVNYAKAKGYNADGCYYCCPKAHRG